MRTYTGYKLTDAQLRRLAALANPDGGGATGGVAAMALERRGLVRQLYAQITTPSGATREVRARRELTTAGREALAWARREGW